MNGKVTGVVGSSWQGDAANAFGAYIQQFSTKSQTIDGDLEKLSQGQRAGVERLYLERIGALKELDAHLVITVPLYLCYAAAGASLIGLYGGEVVVLPMVEQRAATGARGIY